MRRRGTEELSRVPIFRELTPRQLRRILRSMEEYDYRNGRTIVAEGQRSEQLFVILDGTVRVARRGRTVARLGPGDFFGEISMLDGMPRTATVAADGDVRCLVLLRREFESLVRDVPTIGMKVLRVMATRVRQIGRAPKD